MPTIRLGDVPFYFEEVGEGPPLLLLHGLGSSGADWLLQRAVFARRYRVLTFDLRGHGRSAPIPTTSVDRYTVDVATFLDATNWRQVHVVGLSLGGMVAQRLALDRPDLVASLILVNTCARLRISLLVLPILFLRLWAVARTDPQRLGRSVAANLFPHPDQRPLYEETARRYSQNDLRCYRAAMIAAGRFNVKAELGRLSMPTLVVAGDRDTVISWPHKVRLARLIPGARLAVIHNSGHATPMDQPARFNRTVLDFLDRVTSV